MRHLAVLSGLLLGSLALADKPITITFLHTNDLHAHIEPTIIRGEGYGGYARHATLIKEIKKKEKNVVLLNAGDVFQGTLYFSVYDGLADLAIMNHIGYQAMTLGNHEFDKGPATLIEFAKRAKFPLLCANLDAKAEPQLAKYVQPSTIITVGKERVGVVGSITETTPNISSPGPTVKFTDTLTSVQSAVDELTKQGVNKIVVMSHVGYDEDKALAQKLKNVDLIIGGHSHTPLGTPALPGWRPSGGPYPTKVANADGSETLIVQAWEWGKVMGKIKLSFDAKGKVTRVDEASAIVVDKSIPEDPDVLAMVDTFKKPVDAVGLAKVGRVDASITDRTQVGYFVADSYLDATRKLGAVAAFMNPGGVRANMEAGDMTYGQAVSICPFKNTLVICDMTGAQIETLLSQSKGGLIPSVGTKYTLAGGGARDIVIDGAPLDKAKTYKIVVNNFMAGGGDALEVLKSTKQLDTGLLDIDAFIDFIKKASPLKLTGEVRINK